MAVLETSVTFKTRENMKKSAKNEKKQVKKVLVVAQELKLARVLAGNNKTARDRALKSLKKWFQHRSNAIPFAEDDFMRLWKGLFYSMWMSDKPLIQEECAENIASLVHSLPLNAALLFFKCGIKCLSNEWFGIDQLRLDKFLMFVRRFLRQGFFLLKNENWNREYINTFTQCLSETLLQPKNHKPMGLLLHFIEIYVEELAKVAEGQLPAHLTTNFLQPFIKLLAYSDDPRIIDHIKRHIFIYLIRQSDLGLEYDEKYKAWRSLGFPGSIDAMQKVEVDEDEELAIEEGEQEKKEKVYDPRAGRVDVEMSQLKFHSKTLAKALSEYKFDKMTNQKSRACLNTLVEHFKKLAARIYPLGVKKVKLETNVYDTSVRKAVNRLVKFDQKIKGKKSKKRKNEDVIELRGGKKIKTEGAFMEASTKILQNGTKKRKNVDTSESPSKKLKIKGSKLEIESIFKRNSGTWLVTKSVRVSEDGNSSQSDFDESQEKIEPVKVSEYSNSSQSDFNESQGKIEPETMMEVTESPEKHLFPNHEWENSNDDSAKIFESSVKRNRLSLPAKLIKNPFANSTPVKKVKINTKLNQSQDVQQHRAQILSSPAIPYDANKKPSKPLLKTSLQSPINPFYSNY